MVLIIMLSLTLMNKLIYENSILKLFNVHSNIGFIKLSFVVFSCCVCLLRSLLVGIYNFSLWTKKPYFVFQVSPLQLLVT